MQVPGFSAEEIVSLRSLVQSIRVETSSLYKRTEFGQHIPAGYTPIEQSESFIDAFKKHAPREKLLMLISELSFLDQGFSLMEKAFTSLGLRTFKHLATGTAGIVVLAENEEQTPFVVRMGVDTEAGEEIFYKEGHDRSASPFNLQANITLRQPGFAEFQIMSYVEMERISVPLSFEKLMRAIHEDTCFKEDDAFKDQAFLPDGTIVFVDPGCIPYREEFYDLSPAEQEAEIARSINLIMQRCREWDLPPEFVPMTPDRQGGYKYKQELFFPSPQASGPAPGADDTLDI